MIFQCSAPLIVENVELYGRAFGVHGSSGRCIDIDNAAVYQPLGIVKNRNHQRRGTRLHDAVLQLQHRQRGPDVFAGKSVRNKYPERARRGMRVRHSAHRGHLVVGHAVPPLEDAVLEFQPRHAELPTDPVGADPGADCRDGRGSRNGRARTGHLLLGKHSVLGVPGHRGNVVRCRQLFRAKHQAVVDRDRCTDAIPVPGQPDRHPGRRVARQQHYLSERVRGRFAAGRSVVCIPNDHNDRFGRNLL